jgi:hypothetical protein
MTSGELRELIKAADVYKMSFGKEGQWWRQALDEGVLLLGTDSALYEALDSRDEEATRRAGKAIRSDRYPEGPDDRALGNILLYNNNFRSLPFGSLILHFVSEDKQLYWGIVDEHAPTVVRTENNGFGGETILSARSLSGGWRKESIGRMPLTNIHPQACILAKAQGTLTRVRPTGDDYFHALISDYDRTEWEKKSEWTAEATRKGWHPKPFLPEQRRQRINRQIEDAAQYAFYEINEINRMAATAIQTATYANGQTVVVTIKEKNSSFTQEQLEEEIADLLVMQNYCCQLTGYDFRAPTKNVHLCMSLDRKDSNRGYEPGNLQVVTRAANFYKSASDHADWALKADAMERMAIAIQRRRKMAP